jgi:hypothetical protein
MTKTKTMAFGLVDWLFVVVLGEEPPDEASWTAFLALVAQQGADGIRILYRSEGGEPTKEQRHQLGRVVEGRSVPTVVVSDDAALRAKTLTLSVWRHQVFKLDEMGLALAGLDVPLSRRRLVLNMIDAKLRELETARRAAP